MKLVLLDLLNACNIILAQGHSTSLVFNIFKLEPWTFGIRASFWSFCTLFFGLDVLFRDLVFDRKPGGILETGWGDPVYRPPPPRIPPNPYAGYVKLSVYYEYYHKRSKTDTEYTLTCGNFGKLLVLHNILFDILTKLIL